MPSPSAAIRSPALHGRDTEQDALLRLLDAARGGRGGAAILRGARGTGKTALLDLAAARAGGTGSTDDTGTGIGGTHGAGGFVVLRVRGTEAESHLPYAGLHGLLRPIAGRLPALPPAQAEALTRALELGAADGGLALPAAVLNLLGVAGGPVLACVDDVHHLDAPSREALFFAARRLAGEPVVLLFGTGDGDGDGAAAPDDIPAFELGALDEEAARRLLGDLVPELADDVRASLLEIAHGNPLALEELAGSLSREQISGAAAPPATLPRNGRLWRAYADRLARLPGGTADTLLLLAADPDLETATLAGPLAGPLAGAAGPGCALTALEPAERAGVVVHVAGGGSDGDRYDFREPAMRAVVYDGASLARRRAAHRLLASVLRHDHQRLRRAWHRAAAIRHSVRGHARLFTASSRRPCPGVRKLRSGAQG
ncbi:ATP-binding protein, partial [Streptosporangium sp. NPDC048865]|uniref:ATP-binding protein n=1 Tax=Streptosporangium sp. NPDC048865 TaxID=3155766 RepID=UPI00343F4392